jgi:hypothetical protein
MRPHLRVACVGAIVLLGAGCEGCRPPVSDRSYGEPRFLLELEGLPVEASEVDFGVVPMTKRVTQKVLLRNVGRGVLRFEGFAKEGDGAAVQLGADVVEPAPVFGIDIEAFDLPSGESRELTFFFQPPEVMMPVVDHTVRLRLRASNTAPDLAPALLTLKGRAIRGECEFPSRIDFGAVARGDTFKVVEQLKNRRMVDSFPRVDLIMSAQGEGIFTFSADTPTGVFTLGPGRDRNVTFQFSPTEVRDYTANVTVLPADGCPEVVVRLVGSGVDNVLSWAPTPLDFGYIPPGITVTQELSFSNQSFKPVQVTMLATREGSMPSNIYKVAMADMGDVTRLTVPGGKRDMANAIVPGTAKLTVSFRPTVLGPRQGTLTAATDAPSQANISVPLRGFGGGPDIEVTPAPTLNMGRIAFFSGNTAAATRKITIRNVGTRPTPPDPRANLKLGAMGAGRPYWTVTAKNAESTLDEICIGTFDTMSGTCTNDLPMMGPGSYDPSVGIEAAGAAASLDIPIRVAPKNLNVGTSGNKEWEVVFFSNDPDEPEVRVMVIARPVSLPPCQYTLAPVDLSFGVVTPPNVKDLSFQVCNVAPATATGNICLLTNLDLGVGSDPMFSLPAGMVPEKELLPQECAVIQARAWPQSGLPANPTRVTGSVVFNISSDDPQRAQGRVTLSATLAPSCLVISPSTLDFGTVQQGCNSSDRRFQVYNACANPVQWVGAGLVAVGETAMAGTQNCAGPGNCQEFNVTAQPAVNLLPPCANDAGVCLNQGGTPLSFQLKYRPLNINIDTGAYRIQVVQAGQQVDYLVTLQGRGDTMGLNKDSFQQDSKPKADILLVVDTSGSMSEEQMSLATNFKSFIQYAIDSRVDFQIGLTTTYFTGAGGIAPETGDLCRVDSVVMNGQQCTGGTGPKILTPQTANLEQTFAQLVSKGTSGSGSESCVEPAVKALTAPKITDVNANAGLLRPDAVLAVVCVTDESEQANLPISLYVNQLLNIKGSQRSNLFTYNVIGPFTALGGTCSADDQGGRHAELVRQTNGIREEICTPNWATALENIGKGAFGFRTTFFLNGTPSAGNQVSVEIDGMPQPARDARGAVVWNYDSALNAVVFNPNYVPEPGQTLSINYQVACL